MTDAICGDFNILADTQKIFLCYLILREICSAVMVHNLISLKHIGFVGYGQRTIEVLLHQ